jgi:ferredoxin-nitrite reductase
MNPDFSDEQKRYLEGLGRGLAVARGAAPASTAAVVCGPDSALLRAQRRAVEQGGTLTREEEAKRDKHPFDIWDEIVARADNGEFPKGVDVFRYKFHGLFHVAPAQHSFMCRLRIPNGIVDAQRFAAIAGLAERYGGGYVHVTTRANLQLREIAPQYTIDVLQGLADAGLTSRGAGADNVRNITGNPTAGIDPAELYDTRALGLALHHAILNHRDLHGLPRKFNIAFDGGGSVASLADTNDIGFTAVQVGDGNAVAAGIRFRIGVAGITGHGDFTTDLGVAIEPAQCVAVAMAIVKVFIDEGDRTDRTRARLKYVLERMGRDAFVAAVESRLGTSLPRLPIGDCAPRAPQVRGAHVGFHQQRQQGRVWCGVALPAGKLSTAQMRELAAIASRHGSGTLRLTVWQNLLVSDIDEADCDAVESALRAIGLTSQASPIRAGIVACTGNTGCKFAASDTKRHALEIVAHVERRVPLDVPLNVHLTGCPHSCAQHFIGDIGLLGARVANGDDGDVEGYHLFAGGGSGDQRGLGREILRDVRAPDVPAAIERLLAAYLERRLPDESFAAFSRRHAAAELGAFALTPAGAGDALRPEAS